jgi:conjugal transfer pilus assembly protein TraU
MRRQVIQALLFLVATTMATTASTQTCTGKFANPITDICWSCVMPISIGAIPVATLGQEDIENPASPICICPPYRIGLSIWFWEPVRQVDVTR